MLMMFFIVLLLFFIIPTIGILKIYQKSGRSGIIAFIPIVNFWFLFPIAGLSSWMFLLLFIPIINFFVMIYLYIKLSEKFSKGLFYALGIAFMPFLFLPLLGFNGEYRK